MPGPDAGRPVAGNAPQRSSRLRRLLLLGLAVVCSWRLVDSAAVSVAFLAEVDLARRVEILGLGDQERTDRTLRRAAVLLEPLRARVPPDGMVVLSRRTADLSSESQARLLLLRHQLAVLLYPAEVLAVGGPLPDEFSTNSAGRDLWLADLSPELPVPPAFELALELDGYRIWRWRGTGR